MTKEKADRDPRALQLSETEWRVMQVVWRLGRATARQVHAEVLEDTGWAYTTVKTLLDRLVVKGALSADSHGASIVFATRITPRSARRHAVRSLLDRAFGGSFAPFARFLIDEELTRAERTELRRLLAESVPSEPEAEQQQRKRKQKRGQGRAGR